jgi:GT2 family glycosyltransferase
MADDLAHAEVIAAGAIHLDGKPSHHGRVADGIEGFCRGLFLHALATAAGSPNPALDAAYSSGLHVAFGLRPTWPAPSKQPSLAVEAASLALALWLHPALWDGLDEVPRRTLVAWFEDALIVAAAKRNNWLLFCLVIEQFLDAKGAGSHASANVAADAARRIELQYRGQGWYTDGDVGTFDYYNAFAFHYYPHMVTFLGGTVPHHDQVLSHTREFNAQVLDLIGTQGAPVKFGRSLTYRWGIAASLSAEALVTSDPGVVRENLAAAMRMTEWFVGEHSLDQGRLRLGWTEADSGVAQEYSGPVASYWAAKGMVGLLLDPTHPGWQHSTLVPRHSTVRVLDVPGLLVMRSDAGRTVRVANHGSSRGNWGRLPPRAAEPLYGAIESTNEPAARAAVAATGVGFVIESRGKALGRRFNHTTGTGPQWAASLSTVEPFVSTISPPSGRLTRAVARRLGSVSRRILKPLRVATLTLAVDGWYIHAMTAHGRRLPRDAKVTFAGWKVAEEPDPALQTRLVALTPPAESRSLAPGQVSLAPSPVYVVATFMGRDSTPEPTIAVGREGATVDCDGQRHRLTFSPHQPLHLEEPKPQLSTPLIAIATYRRPQQLEALLDSLLRFCGSEAHGNVVVVDNDESGGAADVVARHGLGVRYIHEPTPGIPAARNAALAALEPRHDSMIFVDDDEQVTDGWHAALLRAAAREEADVVQGAVVTDTAGLPRWAMRGNYLQRHLPQDGTVLRSAATNNTLLRRSTWEDAGMPQFNVNYANSGGSDTELFARLYAKGARIVSTSAAHVIESVPAQRVRMRWIVRRAIRNGMVAARVNREVRSGHLTAGAALQSIAMGLCAWPLLALTGSPHQGRALRRGLMGVGFFADAAGKRINEYSRG